MSKCQSITQLGYAVVKFFKTKIQEEINSSSVYLANVCGKKEECSVITIKITTDLAPRTAALRKKIEADKVETKTEMLSPTATLRKDREADKVENHHAHRTPGAQAEIQKPDNEMMMELFDLYNRRNLWQRFPRITAHFLHEFDQVVISEAELAKKVLMAAKIDERDEEISEEELIKAVYSSPIKEEGTQEYTVPTTGTCTTQDTSAPTGKKDDAEEHGPTRPTKRRRVKSSRNKKKRPGIEPSTRQRMTKDKELEMVEDDKWNAEQGKKEY